jgi:hypothetical protein
MTWFAHGPLGGHRVLADKRVIRDQHAMTTALYAKSNHTTLVHANSRGPSPTGVLANLIVPILYVI